MTGVRVVEYDPAWPTRFEAIRTTVWPHVADIAVAIEHVGSTSVPGLAAKPVIDLDIIVATPADAAVAIELLESIGYEHRGDLGIAGRAAFRRPPDSDRHNLYVCVRDGLAVRNHLAVRDRLRRDPAARAAYAALKRELVRRSMDAADRDAALDAYTTGKTGLILGWLAEAGFTDEERGEIGESNRPA